MLVEWKPVPGFEDFYEVSNTGDVRSLDRKCLGVDGRSEFHLGKVLHPWASKRGGYLCVTLSGKQRRTVHSIVAEAFLGPRPEKSDVLHLDGNRVNNCASNLRYGTRKENLNQTYEYGGKQARGELSASDVQQIRFLLRSGVSPRVIAEQYEVNNAAIYHIRNGTTFKWLPGEVTG